MSDTEAVTRAVLTADGRVLIEQPDGSFRPAEGQTDWQRVDRMTEEELEAAIAVLRAYMEARWRDPGDRRARDDDWVIRAYLRLNGGAGCGHMLVSGTPVVLTCKVRSRFHASKAASGQLDLITSWKISATLTV